MKPTHLLCDIGGTNIRFGLATATQKPQKISSFPCEKFSGLCDAIDFFMKEASVPPQTIQTACFSIAAPILGQQVQMTNLSWSFSLSEIQSFLQIEKVFFLNDLEAQAYNLQDPTFPTLGLQKGESAERVAPKAIISPGTGLGLALLVPCGLSWKAIPTEGGHASFSFTNPTEKPVWEWFENKYGHVSFERILSGAGILDLYLCFCHLHGQKPLLPNPEQISHAALQEECTLAKQAILFFLKTLGHFAGNVALTTGALGGIYLSGDILRSLQKGMDLSVTLSAFCNKGRYQKYLQQIPVHFLNHSFLGIHGTWNFLQQNSQQSTKH